MEAVTKFISNITTYIPKLCHLCKQPNANRFLCNSCLADLPKLSNHCIQCALPLPGEGSTPLEQMCGACLKQTPAFHRTYCRFVYDFPLDQLLAQCKEHGKWQIGVQLADLMAAHLMALENENQPDVICFVPLHWRRIMQRGFNQSEIFARRLSKKLSIPVIKCLKKSKRTRIQHSLKRIDRLRNLNGAFTVINEDLICKKHLALVDDVVTTGATSETLARALLEAGASRIDIWALARTVKTSQSTITTKA